MAQRLAPAAGRHVITGRPASCGGQTILARHTPPPRIAVSPDASTVAPFSGRSQWLPSSTQLPKWLSDIPKKLVSGALRFRCVRAWWEQGGARDGVGQDRKASTRTRSRRKHPLTSSLIHNIV